MADVTFSEKYSPTVKDYPSLWVHIDAAWAGVALSCDEYRKELYLDEINSFANSFCTNFHKVRCLAPALVTGCEVDEQRAIVKGRLGVLKSNLADDCETDALGMLVEWIGGCKEQTHLVCTGDDADSAV